MTNVVLDFNEDDPNEDLHDQARVQDAQAKFLQAQTLIQSSTKPKRKTRVGKIQAGMCAT